MRVVFIVGKPLCKCGSVKEAFSSTTTFVIRCPTCGWSDCCPVGDSKIRTEDEFGPVTVARLDGLRFNEYCAKVEKEEKVPE